MPKFTETWKQKAQELKVEVYALYLAYKDPRVPFFARVFAACVAGYAFSPIDLIPDPIPILGYVDDLLLIPIGVILARRMIPRAVLAECREQAQVEMKRGKPVNWAAAGVIIAIWVLAAIAAIVLIERILNIS